MATYVPAKKNTAYILYIALVSQADTKLLKSTPTLASGDFQVSIDGGAFANLATLPTNTPGGVLVKVSLSSSEMNGDNISIACIDAAGAEWCGMLINIQTAARQIDDLAYPATSGRSMVVDASGLVDANAVKIGPTGSGTAQTARDVGASVLLSTGTGTGQLDFTAGVVKGNTTQFAGQTVTAAAGVTLPSSVASPTNITAGVITTVTNLTNAPTAGDFTATMKTSLNAATPASVTGAVASVTGNVGGNVVGSVGSVVGAVGSVTADVGITQAAADKVFGASGAALPELSQAQPSATPGPAAALMLMYMTLRNNLTTTASTKSVFNNAGTVIAKKALADDGTTYTETKMVTGP